MTTNLYLCQACGQVWQIEKSGTLTTSVPLFCPACAGALKPTRSSFGSLEAACFSAYDKTLVRLLYEQWGANLKDEKHAHPSFINYIEALVNG